MKAKLLEWNGKMIIEISSFSLYDYTCPTILHLRPTLAKAFYDDTKPEEIQEEMKEIVNEIIDILNNE